MDIMKIKKEPVEEVLMSELVRSEEIQTNVGSTTTCSSEEKEPQNLVKKVPKVVKSGTNPNLINTIVQAMKYEDKNFRAITIKHFEILHKYYEKVQLHGPAAFPNRNDYQDFATAKLWMDKMNLMVEMGANKKDPVTAPENEPILRKFDDISTIFQWDVDKQKKRMEFLTNLKRGDVLDLKVLKEAENQFELLIVNKYQESERLCDYVICAILMKSPALLKLNLSLQPGAFIRAIMFGTSGPNLLVTLTPSFLGKEYKNSKIALGQIFKSEIPFNDAYQYTNSGEYFDSQPGISPNSEYFSALVSSVGLDPYKVYNFSAAIDGLVSQTKEPSSDMSRWKKSLDDVKCSKFYGEWKKHKECMEYLNHALEVYPENDVAYRARGTLYYNEADKDGLPPELYNAYSDYKMAVRLNPSNENNIVDYSKIVILICKRLIAMNELHKAALEGLKQIETINKYFEERWIPEGTNASRERVNLRKEAKNLLEKLANRNVSGEILQPQNIKKENEKECSEYPRDEGVAPPTPAEVKRADTGVQNMEVDESTMSVDHHANPNEMQNNYGALPGQENVAATIMQQLRLIRLKSDSHKKSTNQMEAATNTHAPPEQNRNVNVSQQSVNIDDIVQKIKRE